MVHFLLTGKYTVYGLSSFIGHNREKETHKTFKKYGASAGDHTNFSKKSTDQRLIYTLIIQSHNQSHSTSPSCPILLSCAKCFTSMTIFV